MSGKRNFQVEETSISKRPKLECLSSTAQQLNSNKRNIMEKSQSLMESFISNPGFEHLGFNILKHFDKAALLSLSLINHSWRDFVLNPRFWMKKLNCKNGESMHTDLYKAWFDLIHKVEEENIDLKQNIALNLIKMGDNSPNRKKIISIECCFFIWRFIFG